MKRISTTSIIFVRRVSIVRQTRSSSYAPRRDHNHVCPRLIQLNYSITKSVKAAIETKSQQRIIQFRTTTREIFFAKLPSKYNELKTNEILPDLYLLSIRNRNKYASKDALLSQEQTRRAEDIFLVDHLKNVTFSLIVRVAYLTVFPSVCGLNLEPIEG